MAKNDFINTTIGSFREKLDNALKGDNAGPEILLAVQELLKEINNKYPQTAYRPDMEASNQNEPNQLPEGVQYMLKNIAALSKK